MPAAVKQMTPLSDLIERLENATEPDREFDARISAEIEGRDINGPINSACWANAYFARSRKPPHDNCYMFTPAEPGRPVLVASHVKPFTQSIDAALLLMPDGHAWYVRRNCSADGDEIYCNAQVWPFCNPRNDKSPRYWAISNEKYPAIALCIAALKARVASNAS